MNKIIEYINKIEFDMSIKFPPVYKRFLIEEIKDSEAYEITNKKHEILYLYNYSDLMEGANKRGNSSRLTQSFHFFMFEPIFSPVNALNQPI